MCIILELALRMIKLIEHFLILILFTLCFPLLYHQDQF